MEVFCHNNIGNKFGSVQGVIIVKQIYEGAG